MTAFTTGPISRYRAAAYHLIISLAVFVVLAYAVVFVWYPDFFYAIDGGWEGMRIIIAVDLVLGPVLTLIVYRTGKPGLTFDLTMIGLFQSACLAAGVYIVYIERPLFFIYYEKHFYSSSADTYKRYSRPTPDPGAYSDTTPAFVISRLPDNPIEEADVRRILFQDELPAWAYQATYSPLSEHLAEILRDGTPEADLVQRDTLGNLDSWLADNGGEFEDYAFFPIHSRYRDAFLGIRRSDLQFVGIVLIPPPV